jgi:hypothetical protein
VGSVQDQVVTVSVQGLVGSSHSQQQGAAVVGEAQGQAGTISQGQGQSIIFSLPEGAVAREEQAVFHGVANQPRSLVIGQVKNVLQQLQLTSANVSGSLSLSLPAKSGTASAGAGIVAGQPSLLQPLSVLPASFTSVTKASPGTVVIPTTPTPSTTLQVPGPGGKNVSLLLQLTNNAGKVQAVVTNPNVAGHTLVPASPVPASPAASATPTLSSGTYGSGLKKPFVQYARVETKSVGMG